MLHLRSLMVLSLIFVITNIGTAVGSELITFSEYTEWTEITNQYANRGIIFGSDNNVPFIVTPLGETDPVLSGRPQYYGAIEGRFVDPNDGVTPMTVSSFSLDAGYFDQMGSTKIEWFGPNDHKLGEQTNSIIGYHHFEINGCYIARWRIAITGSEPYGYAVDNISFDFGPCGLNKIDNINNNNCVRESNEIIYTISYEIGPLGAANVMVVDRLADEVNYNSSAPQGDYNALDKTVTWNFGNLSPWASGSVELTVTVNGSAQPGQTIVNYAELESDNYNATAFEDTSVCSLPSNTIYVDIDANGANDGTSWDNAFVDFNDALEAAPNYLSEMGSCEIWVAEGTYKPDYEGTDYYSATFQMLEGNIAIRGHFGGVGVYETSPDQRDFNDSAYETILDGRVGPSGQKATYLVTCDDIGSGLILDGFTFTGAGFYGLYITNYSDPSIIRCKFNGNGYNGIRTEEYSYPDVADCLFLENGTAGIYSEHSSWPYVKNCIFDGNNHNSYGLQGLYSDMIVEKCVIKRQSVNGMYFSYSSVTVMDCNIENTQRGINCSNCQYIEVADSFLQKNNDAIYCSTSNLGVRGCIIQGNNISGITSLFASVPTITNNIIFNNRQYGVKLDNCENIDIKNNWIHHNGYGFPSDGSGLYFRYSNSPPLVRNNTIVGNAYFGIFVNLGMEPCLVNNIIRQNGINIYSERGLEDVNVSYCCIEGGFTGAGNIDRDPCFVDYDANNFHLKPVSLCIDAGDPCADYDGETDIDGEPRVANGRADIGADESYWPKADYNLDEIVNFIDFALLYDDWQSLDSNHSLDGDTDVDINDLEIFCDNWLWTAAWSASYGMFEMQQGIGDMALVAQIPEVLNDEIISQDSQEETIDSVCEEQAESNAGPMTDEHIQELIDWTQELLQLEPELQDMLNPENLQIIINSLKEELND